MLQIQKEQKMKYKIVKDPTQLKPYTKVKMTEIEIGKSKINNFSCKEKAILQQMQRIENVVNAGLCSFAETKTYSYSVELVVTKHLK